MGNMIGVIVKNKALIGYVLVAGLIGYLIVQNKLTEAKYEKALAGLNNTISSMQTAQLEAMKKQDEYIQEIYKSANERKEQLNEEIRRENKDIEDWANTIISYIDERLQSTVEQSVNRGTTKAISNSRDSLRNTAIVLNQKFSSQVSRDIIELVTDAERTRVALGKCIQWSDDLKLKIESPQTTPNN